MAILKIARMGHPVLRMVAQPVEDPTAPPVRQLVANMVETMSDAGGTGLAAPQVHVSRRILVFFVGDGRGGAGGQEVPLTVLINPELKLLGGETAYDWEACLSVPGLRGLVPRHAKVRYGGVTLDGERVEMEAEGFHARVIQHEFDHLDGILYPQRMDDLSLLMFDEEVRHGLPDRARALMERNDGTEPDSQAEAG